MIQGEFTAKEIEVYRFMHEFRKNASSGEITVTFHNFDFDKILNMRYGTKLTGQVSPENVEFTNKIIKLMGFNEPEEV
jgi:hypothetical protein